MLRQLHSIPGLIASIFIIILAVSGAIMSTEPLLDRIDAGSASEMSVAQLANLVVKNHAGTELITRSANGTIVAQYFNDDGAGNDVINPQTGKSIKPQQRSEIYSFFKQLHRTFYIGITGRIVAGITAFIMLLACVSGLFMLAKRLGGWQQLFATSKGKKIPRLHVDVSRWVILGLFITSLTGTYMSLAKFEFIDDGKGGFLPFPENVTGAEPVPIADLLALKNIQLSNLRELRFPFPDDPFDVYTIITADGQGLIDQASGEMIIYQPNSTSRTIYEFFYMLHTGQGLWWLGILLGISALGLPIMAITGVIIWWRRRSSSPKTKGNVAANKAKIILLVGSETNVTWGFAKHLHQKLSALGVTIHIAEMNAFAPQNYKQAEKIIFLAATYGDGSAPETATKFLQRLTKTTDLPNFKYTILGFGDKQFDQFAKFAFDVEAALDVKGWQSFLPMDLMDRQSSQAFENWGINLGKAMGVELSLNHIAEQPKTYKLALNNTTDYVFDDSFSTRILHFSLPANMPKFEAGDLVGIMPPDSATSASQNVARYYSLATSSTDGTLGICVAKKQGGLCSPFLHSLTVGDEIEAYVQINAHFRPAANNAPIIMIAAGTGIAPFIGFIVSNSSDREAHLYWGGRHPEADFLYQNELEQAIKSGNLTSLNTAFSRVKNGFYVQQKLSQDAAKICDIMQSQGGQIIVCGGRNMANAVKVTLTTMGLDLTALKLENRYIEDVY